MSLHLSPPSTKRPRRVAFAVALLVTAVAGARDARPASPAAPPHAIGGDVAFAAGQLDGARSAYAAERVREPHDARAAYGLARVALYGDDLALAERETRWFAAEAPGDVRARRLLREIARRRAARTDGRLSSDDVDVPLVRIDPLPEVMVRIDGRIATCVVDTGGGTLALSPSFARELGLATHASGEATFAGGRRAALRSGRVTSFAIGRASIASMPIVVAPTPPGVDGVIGTNVLYRFLTTIDYGRRRLVLRPRSASSRFESAARGRHATRVPMWLVPDHFIFVRAGVGRAPSALFNVDTGGPGVGVDLTKAEIARAAIVPDLKNVREFVGGGGPTSVVPFETDVTFGERKVRSVPGIYVEGANRYAIFPFAVAGALSQETFRSGALTFDFAAMTLVYDASSPNDRSATQRVRITSVRRSRASSKS